MARLASPNHRTSPLSWLRSPAAQSMSVDFPAPLEPTNATDSPTATVRLTPRRTSAVARQPPLPTLNRLVTPQSSRATITPIDTKPRRATCHHINARIIESHLDHWRNQAPNRSFDSRVLGAIRALSRSNEFQLDSSEYAWNNWERGLPRKRANEQHDLVGDLGAQKVRRSHRPSATFVVRSSGSQPRGDQALLVRPARSAEVTMSTGGPGAATTPPPGTGTRSMSGRSRVVRRNPCPS